MRIHIRNGRVIDPANGVDAVHDVYVAAGRILAVGAAPAGFEAQRVIDATGRCVVPGLVDLSARLREPGFGHKGTIESETRAAAAGGITTVCVPPDTYPVIDTPAVIELIHQRAEAAGYAHVVTLGALTAGLGGAQLSEMASLKRAGCVGVSNAYAPMADTLVLRRAMEYAASHELTVFLHAEDACLAGNGCAHEGAVSVRLGLPGIPAAAETVEVARVLMLVEQTGARTHFCQLSTARAVQMVARAQHDGRPVTADVSIHHLHLTEMDLADFNCNCKVRPPLRTQRDLDGLRTGLGNGVLGAIASDHQPHDHDAKFAPFCDAESGISSFETLLPLTLRLVDNGLLSLGDAIACLTQQPARILGIQTGTLSTGARADICIFDPAQHWQVEADMLLSHGKNTPYGGWEMQGRVTHTLSDGRIVHEL